jgi:predicted MFS family arabinose efflux permease
MWSPEGWLVFVSVGVWGLAFGGAATLLQTASAAAAGAAGDLAQSLTVTCWNIGIAGGAIAGGFLITGIGPTALPWSALVFLVLALTVTVLSNRNGFPTRQSVTE